MNLYPKIRNIKKSKFILNLLLLLSCIVIIACFIINYFVRGRVNWSFLVAAGIIYTWVAVLYSIRKDVNIASHVMVQMIILTILVVGIDFILGFKRWSIEIAIPIIIMVVNTTFFVLTIVNHKRYIKYVIYQLVIFVLSIIPIFTIFVHIIDHYTLMIVATSIAVFTMLFTVIVCGKQVREEVIKRFHI